MFHNCGGDQMSFNLQNNETFGFAVNDADSMKNNQVEEKICVLHFQTWAIWHVRLLLLTDTEMLQYEGSIVPLKLLLLVGLLHNDGNIVKMVFCQMYFSLIYFFFQPEISVSIWALWSVENNASEKQLLEWPICYSSPFIYPKLQTY